MNFVKINTGEVSKTRFQAASGLFGEKKMLIGEDFALLLFFK